MTRLLLRKDNKSFSELSIMNLTLPTELEDSDPPESPALARYYFHLMVSSISTNPVEHTNFRRIGDFLEPGDVLVINTSGTLNAALPAIRSDGTHLELHLSTHLPAKLWAVEMRAYQHEQEKTTGPFYDIHPGESFALPAGASATPVSYTHLTLPSN